jgi:hypothetical protein
MTPQPCISHIGEEGDCWRACIASVLNMEVGDVPNFCEVVKHHSDHAALYEETRRWLGERGVGMFRTYCTEHWELDKLLECFSAPNTNIPIIITGWSRGDNHAVIAMNGRIVHDPDGGAGLSGPPRNEKGELCSWWLYIVAFTAESPCPWEVHK